MNKNRITLLVIALLCFAPVGLATLLYFYGENWQPKGRNNHGELISPARPLTDLTLYELQNDQPVTLQMLKGKWQMLTVTSSDCATICQKNLYKMRQVRLSLSKDMQRIQRLLLIMNPAKLTDVAHLHEEYTGTRLLTGQDIPLNNLLSQLHLNADDREVESRIYIIDPLGNLMMYYSADADPGDIRKDLKKLLKLSHIG